MTIAAALPCKEGVILCSDSLISGGELNAAQKKLIHFNVPNLGINVAVAFAGTVAECLMVVSDLAHHLNSLEANASFTDWDFRSALISVLTVFHREHIFFHPYYGYTGGPVVHLALAVQYTATNAVTIFETRETTVNVSTCALVGIGESIARYIIEPLIVVSLSSMTRGHVLLLADHMLHQVKCFVPYCGGACQFFFVGFDGSFCNPPHRPILPEARSETFRRIVADLFYASADLDLNDDLVNIGLHLTDKRIKQIRVEQRSEGARRQELGPPTYGWPLIGIGPSVERYKPNPS